jgi:hypothetical protein
MAMSSDLKNSLEKLQAETKAARLRALMPLIESKIREGIRHVEIIRSLNEQGFALSEYTYRSYLQRYRKKQKTAGEQRTCFVQGANDSNRANESSDAGRRPPTFDYDPRGIPNLLK